MQQGKLVGSFGDAVVDAANNPNGAMNGMMGVGMVGMASGGMMQGAVAGAFNNKGTTMQDVQGGAQAPAEGAKYCPNCGTPATGKFCTNCGTQIQ